VRPVDIPQPLRLGAIKGGDDLHASDSGKGPAQLLKALFERRLKLELSVPESQIRWSKRQASGRLSMCLSPSATVGAGPPRLGWPSRAGDGMDHVNHKWSDAVAACTLQRDDERAGMSRDGEGANSPLNIALTPARAALYR
jgi:hypothetical protein